MALPIKLVQYIKKRLDLIVYLQQLHFQEKVPKNRQKHEIFFGAKILHRKHFTIENLASNLVWSLTIYKGL